MNPFTELSADDFDSLRSECDQLRRRIAEIEADKRRLDWLDKHEFKPAYITGYGWLTGEAFRQAIDAAMEGK